MNMRDYLTLYLRHKVTEQLVIRKDMDVNEHERLSNFTLRHKIKVKEQHFYCFYAYHSHSRVFNNENNSYPKICVK
jgi:hypothetical protein